MEIFGKLYTRNIIEIITTAMMNMGESKKFKIFFRIFFFLMYLGFRVWVPCKQCRSRLDIHLGCRRLRFRPNKLEECT
jgi:hypothetical protein